MVIRMRHDHRIHRKDGRPKNGDIHKLEGWQGDAAQDKYRVCQESEGCRADQDKSSVMSIRKDADRQLCGRSDEDWDAGEQGNLACR